MRPGASTRSIAHAGSGRNRPGWSATDPVASPIARSLALRMRSLRPRLSLRRGPPQATPPAPREATIAPPLHAPCLVPQVFTPSSV
jgi:hypothetical protein